MKFQAPLTVQFDAAASSDPEGDSLSYTWTFGDGGTGAGAQTSHTYKKKGTYTARVTVNDGEGGTDSAFLYINVTGGTSGTTTPGFTCGIGAVNASLISLLGLSLVRWRRGRQG